MARPQVTDSPEPLRAETLPPMPLRVTVWMNMPSFYQSDLFRALAARDDVELEVIYGRELSSDRIALGWQNDLRGFRYRFLARGRELRDAVRLAWQQRERVHIVNGIWAEAPFAVALLVFILARSDYVIYMEAPNPDIRRSRLKTLLQRMCGAIALRRIIGTLPISNLAIEFFTKYGVSAKLMYPFGYFRAKLPPDNLIALEQKCESEGSSIKTRRIEIIFVGQLIHRKGLDLLLDAIEPLFAAHAQLHLTLIGDGELHGQLAQRLARADLTRRVTLAGSVASDEILQRLAAADLLVLPSRWDGWGLVVNEAFAVGVPVIVSDACGAADLVVSDVNGYVFQSENVTELRACLSRFLALQNDWESFRQASRAMGERISTAQMADYLASCLKHMTGRARHRPALPWGTTAVAVAAMHAKRQYVKE